MTLSDIFPIFIAAAALWILVYCILMTQKIFMDSQYQEIQPKNRGEDEDAEEHAPHPPVSPVHPNESHKHDHTERTFFAYYL
uniref:Uncharacterized protein n=1 Tax=Caenorhabditis japonica TaxID=281687 RepID=A0A8R1I3T2_CAEJA